MTDTMAAGTIPPAAKRQLDANAAAWPSTRKAWLAAVVLTLAMFFSYIDRNILSLLVEPIKKSLSLSDVQMGLLQGLTFALVFTVMMLPLGWLADKVNRTKLVGVAIAFWSVMTAVCGLSANFTQMFLARMGVAVGEATLSPSGPAIIADYFPPERRTPPLSLYGTAAVFGVAGSLLAGGLVASFLGERQTVSIPGLGTFQAWQVIFFSVGFPGLIVSVLLFLVTEPPRRDKGDAQGTSAEFWNVLRTRGLIIFPQIAGFCLFNLFSNAMGAWMPAYFIRVHGWSIAQVGIRMGLLQLVCGALGAVLGGYVSRALWKRGRRNANLLTAGTFIGLVTIPAVAGTMVSNGVLAALLLGLMTALALAPGGPLLASLQEVTPNGVRGRVTALNYVVLGLFSMALGPLFIGFMNEHVFVDPKSVGKSLALTAVLTLPLAAALLLFAGRQRKKLDWIG